MSGNSPHLLCPSPNREFRAHSAPDITFLANGNASRNKKVHVYWSDSQEEEENGMVVRERENRKSIDEELLTLSDLHERILHQQGYASGDHDISDKTLLYVFIVFVIVGSALIVSNIFW